MREDKDTLVASSKTTSSLPHVSAENHRNTGGTQQMLDTSAEEVLLPAHPTASLVWRWVSNGLGWYIGEGPHRPPDVTHRYQDEIFRSSLLVQEHPGSLGLRDSGVTGLWGVPGRLSVTISQQMLQGVTQAHGGRKHC